MPPAPIEIVFYVHGVSSDPRGRFHTEEYSALHDGVASLSPNWPSRFGGAEWGWNHSGGTPRSHELLTDAQRLLGSRAVPVVEQQRDFTLNLARLAVNGFRELFIYGFGDMFYYVSQDGKAAVRLAVARQIVSYLKKVRRNVQTRPISLTLIGHSAGSVVAFDFLFYLFFTNPGNRHRYIDPARPGATSATNELKKLRSMAQGDRLRIRRLITFGSPITPLACRSDSVLQLLADNRQLDPAHYGLDRNPPGFDRLTGPRWINLWDKDDAIAWPVEPLMQSTRRSQLVEDIYVDVSDSTLAAHDAYWRSSRVYKVIAKHW